MKRYLIQLRHMTTSTHHPMLYVYEVKDLNELYRKLQYEHQDQVEILAVEDV